MHELHLMREVVKMVEGLNLNKGSLPSVVRLQITSQSHLAEHSSQELAKTFDIATYGTFLQGAKLEVVIVPVKGKCQKCGVSLLWSAPTGDCTECGSGSLVWEDHPEVVLTEVEYVEATSP